MGKLSRAKLLCQPQPPGLAGHRQPFLPPPVPLLAPACSTASKSSLQQYGRHQPQGRAGTRMGQDSQHSQGRDLRLSFLSRLSSWETLGFAPTSPYLQLPLAGVRVEFAAASLAQMQVSTPVPQPRDSSTSLLRGFILAGVS